MDISSLGKNPVPGDSPCGEDIRYEPQFEELQQEIDKLSSPSASGTVDWKKIEETSASILSDRSKDLLVAAYLAVALLQNHREKGLVQGVGLMLDMLTHFWADMFPPRKRLKGRLRIIEWWRDKIETLVERLAPLVFSSSEYDTLLSNLAAIDEFLEQHLKDAPKTSTIKRVLEKVSRVEKEEEQQPKPEKTKPAEPGKPSAKSPVASPGQIDIESMDQLDKILNSLLSGLRKAAAFLRVNDPSNPLGYRVWRASIWMPIMEQPPSDNGKTKIPAPQSQLVSVLEGLESNQDWKSLIDAAEARLVQFPFWLDLNYYTFVALKGLGDDYSRAAHVVEKETATFVSLMPGIAKMSFVDGRPFASQETLTWIEKTNQGESEGEQVRQPVPGTPVSRQEEEQCSEARKAAGAGDTLQAVSLLQDAIDQSRNARQRFQLQVCLVEILSRFKKNTLVQAHCQEIIESIDRYHIDEWEPMMAFQGMEAVWRFYSQSRLTDLKRRANEILMRMSMIDLPRVMSLTNE